MSCCVRLRAVLRNEVDLVAAPSPIPLYHQVSTVLRARIVDGVYAEGDQIPTEELLTAEFKVSKEDEERWYALFGVSVRPTWL